MAAELKQNFHAEAELLPGGNGIFDVLVDGDLIYSKYQTGSFPAAEEISGIIREKRF